MLLSHRNTVRALYPPFSFSFLCFLVSSFEYHRERNGRSRRRGSRPRQHAGAHATEFGVTPAEKARSKQTSPSGAPLRRSTAGYNNAGVAAPPSLLSCRGRLVVCLSTPVLSRSRSSRPGVMRFYESQSGLRAPDSALPGAIRFSPRDPDGAMQSSRK